MLNLRRKALGLEDQARGLAEILPWLIQITPGVILNKDGSLMATFLLEGMHVEGCDGITLDREADRLEQALRHFDQRITVWSSVLRRATDHYPEGGFANPASAQIDDLYRRSMATKKRFLNRHFMSILCAQEQARDGFLNHLVRSGGGRSGTLNNQEPMEAEPVPAGFWGSLRQHLFHAKAFDHDRQRLHQRILKFEELLAQFGGNLFSLRPKRLEGPRLLSFLQEMTSPASTVSAAPCLAPTAYLDSTLGQDTIVVEKDHVRFEGISEVRYAAALAIKSWPGETWTGMLDDVLGVSAELTLSQVFRFVEGEAAKRYIKNVQRFHLNLQKSLFSYFREAIAGEESVVKDTGRAVSAEDARQALTDMVAARRVFGYQNLTVLVFSDELSRLDETVSRVASEVQAQGYLLMRERLHLNSSWSGTLPGQWGELVRWHFISSANWADLCPIRSAGYGQRHNDYLTQQTGRHAPALSLFQTAAGSPFYFNLHQQDLAHAFVVGPSRSGKSVWVNFILSQFHKYHPVRVVIFDKDRSCRIPTLLQGGIHLDPGKPQTLSLNPLAQVSSPEQHPWLLGWLELLLGIRGYTLSAPEHKALAQALQGLASMPPHLHRLKSLQGFLPRVLRQELEPWLEGGTWGSYFDHPEDRFELSSMTCIEMGELLRHPALARAFLEYAFHRIESALDTQRGIPTLIYVEEAWFMLSDPYFSGRIRDWLKTIPKKMGSLILATQSLDDLSGSSIFSTIADNIPTRIFLPNAQARVHRALYCGQFGLNDAQIERIERATGKIHYYLNTPQESHLLEVRFSSELLAWLRSDARAQALFDACQTSGQEQWMDLYRNQLLADTP